MWPKIIQVNAKDIYIIGGNDTNLRTQFNFDFRSLKCNIKVNIATGECERKADMLTSRQACGVGCIGNYIYIVGGITEQELLNSCERYDIINDTWEEITSMDEGAFSLSVITHAKRFLYTFGYANYET